MFDPNGEESFNRKSNLDSHSQAGLLGQTVETNHSCSQDEGASPDNFSPAGAGTYNSRLEQVVHKAKRVKKIQALIQSRIAS